LHERRHPLDVRGEDGAVSVLTALARAQAVEAGRAQPLTTVRHTHLSERPLVLVPLSLAGEAAAPLAALVGWDERAPRLLIVPNPRDRTQRFQFVATLAEILLSYVNSCMRTVEQTPGGRGRDARLRYVDAPQVLVPNGGGIEFLRLLGRSTRFRRTYGPNPVPRSVPLFGQWLTFFRDRADHAGSALLLAVTEVLTAHWATGQSGLEDANLAALVGWIAPSGGMGGAEAAVLAEDPVRWPPAGPSTDPTFDNEILAPALAAVLKAASDAELPGARPNNASAGSGVSAAVPPGARPNNASAGSGVSAAVPPGARPNSASAGSGVSAAVPPGARPNSASAGSGVSAAVLPGARPNNASAGSGVSAAAQERAIRGLSAALERQLEPTWRLMWQAIALLRALPEGQSVGSRWAADRDAFSAYAMSLVDGGALPQPRVDSAVAAAGRLDRLEREQARYDAQRALDDPLVMAEFRLAGEAFAGTVVAASPLRRDTSGKKAVLRPYITVQTQDPVRVEPGAKLVSPARTAQTATVVALSTVDVVLELSGGMGRSLTPAPGSVPEVGERVTYGPASDAYQPPGRFPSRDETPWTHGGPPAQYVPTETDAREEWS
jgi:hypothetical protein